MVKRVQDWSLYHTLDAKFSLPARGNVLKTCLTNTTDFRPMDADELENPIWTCFIFFFGWLLAKWSRELNDVYDPRRVFFNSRNNSKGEEAIWKEAEET